MGEVSLAAQREQARKGPARTSKATRSKRRGRYMAVKSWTKSRQGSRRRFATALRLEPIRSPERKRRVRPPPPNLAATGFRIRRREPRVRTFGSILQIARDRDCDTGGDVAARLHPLSKHDGSSSQNVSPADGYEKKAPVDFASRLSRDGVCPENATCQPQDAAGMSRGRSLLKRVSAAARPESPVVTYQS